MKRLATVWVLMLMVFGFTSCEDKNNDMVLTEPKTIELVPGSDIIISGSNRFGIELFTRVALTENQNFTLSPLSASVALTMLLNGAGGETLSQMQSALGYPAQADRATINRAYKSLAGQLLNADPSVVLGLANAMFYRQDFQVKQNFVHTLQMDFDATVRGLDFRQQAAIDAINRWASESTKGKIPTVVESISDETMLFLMNALFFQGNWTHSFNRAATANRSFFVNPQTPIQVPTMKGRFSVRSFSNEMLHAVELPYGRGNFSMVVVLPMQRDIRSLLNTFTPERWMQITSALDAQQASPTIDVYLPRFQFAYRKTLNSQLKAMGMTHAFDSNRANLTGISDIRDLFVHSVRQDTHITVNEEGTTAAAVTTVEVGITSVGPLPFVANKPFLFFIRERTTNTLLFAGQVLNPLE
ncbi:MAG TPA: hypothetical protein DCM62_06285 [Bacteroidales bacterium]|nr:hypothetical protein [Bacteroidales bacterium]